MGLHYLPLTKRHGEIGDFKQTEVVSRLLFGCHVTVGGVITIIPCGW